MKDLGYNLTLKTRSRHGGGVGFICTGHFNLQKSRGKLSVFKTMNILQVDWKLGNKILRLANIYRYPYSRNNTYSEHDLLEEFKCFIQIAGEILP